MDIGKRNDDYTFYEGYEGEKEIIITTPAISYHIWDGYFEDIFGNPAYDSNGWNGFTRDYNECVNMFDDEQVECAILPEEYLSDLNNYYDREFTYDETKDVIKLLSDILGETQKQNTSLLIRVN